MLTTLGSTINMIGQELYEHKKLHLYNEKDIHTSSKNHEAYGYGYDLDLLIILH
jgi:hypothetical protein